MRTDQRVKCIWIWFYIFNIIDSFLKQITKTTVASSMSAFMIQFGIY